MKKEKAMVTKEEKKLTVTPMVPTDEEIEQWAEHDAAQVREDFVRRLWDGEWGNLLLRMQHIERRLNKHIDHRLTMLEDEIDDLKFSPEGYMDDEGLFGLES